jgi:hypothetical protein
MAEPTRRTKLFLDAIAGLVAQQPVRWHTYVSDYEIDNDSMVTFSARRMDTDCSGGCDELLKYCRAILGQGFYVEIGVVDGKELELHVVSWEGDDEPSWDAPEMFDVMVRA